MFEISIYCFVIREAKLHSSFPSVQFHINNYEVRARGDWDETRSGIIELVKEEFICKTLKNLSLMKCSALNLLFLSKSVFVSVFIDLWNVITLNISSKSLQKSLLKPVNFRKTSF